MDEYGRNQEIRHLLTMWSWCSRTLHVKWEREPKHRNSCLMGINWAINQSRSRPEIKLMELTRVYQKLPFPLFSESGLLFLWEVLPARVLEMALGCFTQGSPLEKPLNRLRLSWPDNDTLDKLFKKMTSREERYGWDWPLEGHHPENEFTLLQKEIAPLHDAVKELILAAHPAMEALAREILSQGPWQSGTLPVSALVRRTPESLLSRALRLKLWRVAQEISYRNLEEEEAVEALCDGLYDAITPSVKAAVEAQGYTVDNAVDDFLNFDMHKSRKEITQGQKR